MDDIIKIFENAIQSSKEGHVEKNAKSSWKTCVMLQKSGWRAASAKRDQNDFMVITWQKENDIVQVALSYRDQQMWLEYMKNGEKNVL